MTPRPYQRYIYFDFSRGVWMTYYLAEPAPGCPVEYAHMSLYKPSDETLALYDAAASAAFQKAA